jgi:hypothetical protein
MGLRDGSVVRHKPTIWDSILGLNQMASCQGIQKTHASVGVEASQWWLDSGLQVYVRVHAAIA